MVTLSEIGYSELERLASEAQVRVPVEQTETWARFEDTVPGRTPWGVYRIDCDGELIGMVAFIEYQTHGYRYLRAHHAPIWVKVLSADEERAAIAGIRDAVSKIDHKQAFIRLAVEHDLDICEPTLSTLPYDTTVVLDVTGGEEDILSRMKPRGRRDVRKSLRECPAACADETERAGASFDEYYRIMQETGARDGFAPAPLSDYQAMVNELGEDRCRVFAARAEDGSLLAWSLVTLNDRLATRYYAATTREAGRLRVADKLVLFEACSVAELGCDEYDLMGIGSEFAPETLNLNEFKTKFAKDGVRHVAPDRDVPVKAGFYRALCAVKSYRDGRRAVIEAKAEKAMEGPISPRDDIQPVVLGGDVSAYALCREFHEAFGTPCICVIPAPIAAIANSNFISVHQVPDMDAPSLSTALAEIAREHVDKKVVVMANTDAIVATVEQIQDSFAPNIICPLPPHDLMERVSDKITFAELCAEYGLDAPHSEIVSLAGSDPIAPTAIPFPLIAKPAVSAEYSHLYVKGFKKVYFIKAQDELDALWRDLREVGFTGDFLVQELIEGDDTYVDMITVYVNSKGKATMFAGSQVLLEDHAPSLFGNPVAMITRPMPELWEKVGKMLTDLGWRGFANFDLKRDPKTGRAIFMDFNPRIGRNSYYAVAGGINPMYTLVSDLVDGKGDRVSKVDRTALYTLAPTSMLRRYLRDPDLLREYDAIVSNGAVFNPMRYPADSLRSRIDGALMEKNYVRKFARDYPEPTDTAF